MARHILHPSPLPRKAPLGSDSAPPATFPVTGFPSAGCKALIASLAVGIDPVTMIIPAPLSTSRRADSNRESTGTAAGVHWADHRYSQGAPGNWSMDLKSVI